MLGNTREAVGVARMVLSGLLPACKAAGELGEWEQKKLEAAVARAVVSAQEVVIVLRARATTTHRFLAVHRVPAAGTHRLLALRPLQVPLSRGGNFI